METSISKAIEAGSYAAKYDASVKEMLADKQILARILKYSLEEFANEELETIIRNMDHPEVSQIRMEPGLSNYSKIHKESEENQIPGEGKIYYDIRCSVYLGENLIKILINIEAQKSTNPSKLGYHLDNRIIFYLGRMISAQKEVEFQNSKYDDLKAVRSIWICMDSADDEDSINRIRFKQENVYGKPMQLDNIDKVQGVIIRIRANENADTYSVKFFKNKKVTKCLYKNGRNPLMVLPFFFYYIIVYKSRNEINTINFLYCRQNTTIYLAFYWILCCCSEGGWI